MELHEKRLKIAEAQLEESQRTNALLGELIALLRGRPPIQ
jgi:hypothetical protein